MIRFGTGESVWDLKERSLTWGGISIEEEIKRREERWQEMFTEKLILMLSGLRFPIEMLRMIVGYCGFVWWGNGFDRPTILRRASEAHSRHHVARRRKVDDSKVDRSWNPTRGAARVDSWPYPRLTFRGRWTPSSRGGGSTRRGRISS